MLKSILFTDIYLGESNAWLAGVPGTKDPVRAEATYEQQLNELRSICDAYVKEHEKLEFPIRHGEISFRVAVLKSLNETVYVLRRTAEEVPALATLGIHPVFLQRLLTPNITGLIIVAGSYGHGKTTTASALLAERLTQFGGVAITIEDPPELPLEGIKGEGVCYQTWVEQGGFGAACRQCARWAPSMIYLGEVRDSETAAEALRASINGRLVIVTTHADSVSMAVERMAALAYGAAGSTEDCASLLASGITAVIHQRLDQEDRSLTATMLWVGGSSTDTAGIRNTIKKKAYGQLEQDVQQQINQIRAGIHS